MRKLSKKISMLMVLAMLVSLFSGIVSASAAAPSSWSFKSSKYDVAVGETIEMEKNEYADFDLFRYDAAPEGYTVKWSSSDSDAVWVNAKTGQLRADKLKTADYGDKATISATFTNTKTGKSATRSFVIVVAEKAEYEIEVNFGDEVLAVGQKYDLKAVVKADGKEVEAKVAFAIDGKAIDAAYTPAEEGEFTIVTTATIDGKVVAEAKTVVVVEKSEPAIVAVKQTSLDAVEIKLNNAAAAEKVLADNTLLKAYMVVGGNDMSVYMKSVAAKKDVADTLVVTMFNAFAKETNYKFALGESSVSFAGTDSTPARVEVVSKAIVAKKEGEKMQFKVYNNFGIDITADITALNGYTWKYNVPETNCFFNGIDELYFFEAGKEVVVEFVLDLGYDNAGNKLGELKANGAYYSVAASTSSNPEKYAIEKVGFNSQYTSWGVGLPTMADGDNGYHLVAQYTKKHANGYAESKYIFQGKAENGTGDALFTYKSSNEAVMLIDETTGELTPVAAGSAVLFIVDGNKNTVGAVTVNVVGERKLATFVAPADSSLLSVGLSEVTGAKMAEVIKFKPTPKDQLNADFSSSVVYGYKIAYPLNLEFDDYFETEAVADGSGKIAIKAKDSITTLVADTKTQAFQIEVTAYQNKGAWNEVKKTSAVKFSVKNITTVDPYKTTLTLSNNNVDTKLNQDALWKYNVDVTLVAKDKDAYSLGIMPFTNISKAAEAVTGADLYSVLVLKNNDATSDFTYSAGNKISFSTVFDKDGVDDGVVLDKLSGQYVIKLYKGDGKKAEPVTQQTLNISDTTSKIKAVVESDKLTASWNPAELDTKIKFMRDGSCLDDNGNIVGISSVNSEAVGNKVYVKSVKVIVKAGEMNYGALGAYTFEEEVAVNTLFTVE